MNVLPDKVMVKDLEKASTLRDIKFYFDRMKEQVSPESELHMFLVPPNDYFKFNKEMPISMGMGINSLLLCGILFNKLEYVFSELSGLQQLGLFGSTYDHAEAAEINQNIETTLSEIVFAITGKTIKFIKDKKDEHSKT